MPQISSRYCSRCRMHVAALRGAPNHVLHLIVTLFTCGVWVIPWIFFSMNQGYHCPQCGKTLSSTFDKLVLAVLFVLLAILAVPAVMMLLNGNK